jgi:RHS repeat-associated protein
LEFKYSLLLAVLKLTYTNREYDEETGLYYYRARYYDSTIGRFISEDPIGLAGGINFYAYVDSVGKPFTPLLNETNLYQYALNNPLRYTDPMGLKAMYWCFSIYFTPYFQCFTLEDTGPLRIKNLHGKCSGDTILNS